MLKVFQVHYMNLFGTAMCNRRKIIDKNAKKLVFCMKREIKRCVKNGELQTKIIKIEESYYSPMSNSLKLDIYEYVCNELKSFYGEEVTIDIIYNYFYSNKPLGIQATINKV